MACVKVLNVWKILTRKISTKKASSQLSRDASKTVLDGASAVG